MVSLLVRVTVALRLIYIDLKLYSVLKYREHVIVFSAGTFLFIYGFYQFLS